MIRWGGLDKINIHRVYITECIIYSFSMTIGLRVYDSWNITKQKKIEKITQWPFIKSPPFYMVVVFSLKKILLCIHY